MDKKLKHLRKLYEKYDSSVESSPYYRFITLANKAGNHKSAIRIANAIPEGGISFIPYDREGSLIGKDKDGKTYGRPNLDEVIQIVNRQMKRSGNFDESYYWIYMVDKSGNMLLKLDTRGQIVT